MMLPRRALLRRLVLVRGMSAEAQAAGISVNVVSTALGGVQQDTAVFAFDRRQRSTFTSRPASAPRRRTSERPDGPSDRRRRVTGRGTLICPSGRKSVRFCPCAPRANPFERAKSRARKSEFREPIQADLG